MSRSGRSVGDSQPLNRNVQVTSVFFYSTCGLAEELEQEKNSTQPKSACGNVNSNFCFYALQGMISI